MPDPFRGQTPTCLALRCLTPFVGFEALNVESKCRVDSWSNRRSVLKTAVLRASVLGFMPQTRPTRYSPARRRRAVAIAALLAAVALAAGGAAVVLSADGGPKAEEAVDGFLAAWSRGDDRGAAGWTDDARRAQEELAANRRGLDGAKVSARTLAVSEEGDAARARFEVTWDVPGFGPWSYRSSARLRKGEERWTLAWSPKVVHPQLGDVRVLGTVREAGPRGSILDRDGRAIVRERTVYRVGLARDKVRGRRRVGLRARRGRRRRRRAPCAAPSAAPGPSSSSRRSRCARPTTTPSRRSSTACPACSRSATRRRSRPAASSRARCSARSARPRRSSSRSSRTAAPATRSASPACRPATRAGSAARPRAGS